MSTVADKRKAAQHMLRCERCILGHRPCDGKQPTCTTCATPSIRGGPKTCVYPFKPISRAQLKKVKEEEAKMEEAKKEIEEANEKRIALAKEANAARKIASLPRPQVFRKGMYTGGPRTFDETNDYLKMSGEKEGRVRGGDAGKAGATDDNDDAEKDNEGDDEDTGEQRRSRKRQRTNAQVMPNTTSSHNPSVSAFSARNEEALEAILRDAPNNRHAGYIAPLAPSTGTPFDPHMAALAAQYPHVPLDELVWLKRIADNIIEGLQEFEDNLPKHVGGPFDGRPDYSRAVVPEVDWDEEEYARYLQEDE